ncbi:trans-acting regulatory HvrA protein [Alkalilimnicola ehrlichii]|uniref:Trans-acting regulatory HvrA protein n=1 Tax=Alkalilimnicola ehrlichii TaxID=351052 RepID=A0A3E0X1D0_9GAMM|nr:H-NS histone family protein [Alkalilimnicola ehrlichii]RFA30559.1 trans-acting regulatory HvrA protein [Alkalilimnicola ehrlichii]RFA38106.1 trans-acting regulatory HvrA protein [Alkalilimnicola ehrlichii]
MNLANYNSQELRELRKEIDRELKKRRKQEVKEAQKELKHVAERYGFSLNELLSASPGVKPGAIKGAVRYRHPEDADKTWSGRGRKPSWVKEWEASGRSLEDLRVD